jgi:hypothetical protein
LLIGKSKRINDGEIVLGSNGISNNNRVIARYRMSVWNILIPFLQLTKILLNISKKWTIIERKKIWKIVFLLNVKAVEIQFKLALINMFPRLYKLYKIIK